MYKTDVSLLKEFLSIQIQVRKMMQQNSSLSIEERLATGLQVHALSLIDAHKGITVGDLAKELTMSSAAIAQFVDRMVNSGWVNRESDKDDRRITRLFLLAEGRKKLKLMNIKVLKKMDSILSLMPAKDIKQLISIQKKLLASMEKQND